MEPRAYQRVFRNPNRSADALFTVLASPNGRQTPRLGLAVSKKHLKLAVDRNRVKRLIRESFRNERAGMPAFDLVVLARRECRLASNAKIFESLSSHWLRLAGR